MLPIEIPEGTPHDIVTLAERQAELMRERKALLQRGQTVAIIASLDEERAVWFALHCHGYLVQVGGRWVAEHLECLELHGPNAGIAWNASLMVKGGWSLDPRFLSAHQIAAAMAAVERALPELEKAAEVEAAAERATWGRLRRLWWSVRDVIARIRAV